MEEKETLKKEFPCPRIERFSYSDQRCTKHNVDADADEDGFRAILLNFRIQVANRSQYLSEIKQHNIENCMYERPEI